MCKHEDFPRPEGICSGCGTSTCKIGKENCFCLVGFPYELQCPKCRGIKNRFDEGYCVCDLKMGITEKEPAPVAEKSPLTERVVGSTMVAK